MNELRLIVVMIVFYDRISSHHSSPSTASLHRHSYPESSYLALLLLEDALCLIEFLNVGLLLLRGHAVVPLCSETNDVWRSHVGVLLFDLHALAGHEHIVWVSRWLLHKWDFIIVLLLGLDGHLPRILLSDSGDSGRGSGVSIEYAIDIGWFGIFLEEVPTFFS